MALGTPTQLATGAGAAVTSLAAASCTPTVGAAVIVFVAANDMLSQPTLQMSGFTGAPSFTASPFQTQGMFFYAIWPAGASGTGQFGVTFGTQQAAAEVVVVQVTGATGFGSTCSGHAAAINTLTVNWSTATAGNSDCNVVAVIGENPSSTLPTVNAPTGYTSGAAQLNESAATASVATHWGYNPNAAESSVTGTTAASTSALVMCGVEVLGPRTYVNTMSATQARSATLTSAVVPNLVLQAGQARAATLGMVRSLSATLSAGQARTATLAMNVRTQPVLTAPQARTATLATAITRYGSWTKTYSLAGITAVDHSAISWAQTVPAGDTVQVSASLDGGATWQPCTSGQPIPGLAAGAPVAPGAQLQVRVELWKPDGGASPTVNNLAVQVVGLPSTELLPLGTFVIEEPAARDSGNQRQVTLTGADRSAAIARARLSAPFSGGGYVHDAITNLLSAAYPGLDYSLVQWVPYFIPQVTVQQGADAWATALDWAKAAGYELFISATDQVVLQPIADPRKKAAVWAYAEGSGCQMTEVDKRMGDTSPNDWVRDTGANSNSTTQLYRGQATDDNPRSRAWVHGPYGDVQDYQQVSLLTSAAMATACATGARNLGLHAQDAVQLTIVPNEVLEVDDAVAVTRQALGLAATDLVVVDALSMPLGAESAETVHGRKVTL